MISKRHQIPLSYTYYCLIQFKNPASAFISTESFSQFTIDKVLTMGPTLPSRVRFEQWDPPLPSSIVMCPTYLKWWGSSLQTGHSWSSSKALSSILFLRPCQVPTAAVWALLFFEKKRRNSVMHSPPSSTNLTGSSGDKQNVWAFPHLSLTDGRCGQPRKRVALGWQLSVVDARPE